MNDRGMWISWYDLPDQGKDDYLKWLHGTYIPKILKKPGVLWGAHYANAKIPPHPRLRHTDDKSVPTGNDYILMFGAENAHAFTTGWEYWAKKGANRREDGVTADEKKMLATRKGERQMIFTEENRGDGPEAKLRDAKGTPAPVMQLGTFNSPGCDDELMSWYGDWRIPALMKLPGTVGIRKLVSVVGWAQHAVLYEFASLELREKGMPQLRTIYKEEGAWSDNFTPKLMHAPSSPVVGTRLWPPVGK